MLAAASRSYTHHEADSAKQKNIDAVYGGGPEEYTNKALRHGHSLRAYYLEENKWWIKRLVPARKYSRPPTRE